MKIRALREDYRPAAGLQDLSLLIHPEWDAAWPWLAQGTTCRPTDFALRGPDTMEAWDRLRQSERFPGALHARQPHGARVGVRTAASRGLQLVEDSDGHVTRAAGVLLGVTTADCVPITLVAPSARVVAMVHAGWRGAAAGILERALTRLNAAFGVRPDDLHMHLGPSICGTCYEVGPEVHGALGLPEPADPCPVDLPAVLGNRALAAGVPARSMSRSGWCTLCTGREFLYSHRGGDAGRQIGFVGIRMPGAASGAQ